MPTNTNNFRTHLFAFLMALASQLAVAVGIAVLGVLAQDVPVWLAHLSGIAAAFGGAEIGYHSANTPV